MPLLPTSLKTLVAASATLSASSLWAHPGHRHLEGAPGDMHLHALLDLLPDSPLGSLLLGAVVVVGLLGALYWIRRSR